MNNLCLFSISNDIVDCYGRINKNGEYELTLRGDLTDSDLKSGEWFYDIEESEAFWNNVLAAVIGRLSFRSTAFRLVGTGMSTDGSRIVLESDTHFIVERDNGISHVVEAVAKDGCEANSLTFLAGVRKTLANMFEFVTVHSANGQSCQRLSLRQGLTI